MTGETDKTEAGTATPGMVRLTDGLGLVEKAPRWWHCDTHGAGKLNAWGCPDCVAELRRWKSTHAPRLEALEGMLKDAQLEAHAGREAIATLASERAANALLTERVQMLEFAEEGAKEAFGAVVQDKRDAQAECNRLRKLLDDAHAQIRRQAKLMASKA